MRQHFKLKTPNKPLIRAGLTSDKITLKQSEALKSLDYCSLSPLACRSGILVKTIHCAETAAA